MIKFKFMYAIEPIDFWEKADIADDLITQIVLSQMPEVPRDGIVYKLVVPSPPDLTEIYLCKAENNGTVYVFSNYNLETLSVFGRWENP